MTVSPTQPEPTTGGHPFTRLLQRLGRTRALLGGGLRELLGARGRPQAALLEALEELLLAADVGVEATQALVEEVSGRLGRGESEPERLLEAVRARMRALLEPAAVPLHLARTDGPFVILVVGVNGVGKTTTIGKLARRLQEQGHNVLIAAADTFRAAAVEQISVWAERAGAPVIAQQRGADAAAVAHDALSAAAARGVDVLIVDTAGRQHTDRNLMEELKKIKRVIGRLQPGAPQEVLMVLDAGTGQNALAQLQRFNEAVGVTGLCLAKLDGTAKGGVLLAIARRTSVPVRFIGVGERIDDLREFEPAAFVEALLPQAPESPPPQTRRRK